MTVHCHSTQILNFLTRHNLTREKGARLFGVPISTFYNWTRGIRTPNHSAIRLIEVFTALEILSQEVLRSLVAQSLQK